MSTQQDFSTEPSAPEFDIKEYVAILMKRRALILACVLAALAGAAIVSLLAKPVYRATVVLNVEREKASPMDVGSTAAVYAPYDPEFLPTQTRLMTSREVSERVVKRLRLEQNQAFTEGKSGLFRDSASEDATIEAAKKVQASITTTPVRRTNLVELSVVQPNPKLAADIANAVAEAYIDWNIESKYLVIGQANRFLTTQIEQLKSEIAEKEKQLQAYGRANDIVTTDPQSNVTMQKLESLNKDYAAAVADRVAKEARYYELQNARAESIADSLSAGLVTQLRNDQAKLEREYAEKLNLYKPEWPAMQQLRAQIEKGRQHLASVIQETVQKARDAARTDYQTAQRREASLKAVLQGQTSEAMTMSSNAVEYNNLSVEVKTKRDQLENLLKRQSDTEVSSRLRGERVSNVRVVDRALQPASRFRPSYTRNAAFGLLLGLALGVGFAFLLEYLDRSLRTLDQVERYLNLPALGVIPTVGAASANVYSYGYGRVFGKKKKKDANAPEVAIELLPQSHPRSVVAEAYRAFRTALLLSRAGGLKSLLITSTLPGEGKTTTAVNLATVLAQLGKRVLLIDADLHKPRVHEVFKISNRRGLVSVIAESADPVSVIVPSPIANLFICPSGPQSPNPSGLLSSPAMRKFLDAATHNFDYVILDAPPVGAVADAIVLGYQVDGAVLCVRGGKTPRESVSRTRDRLSRSNVRILGVLINNLEEPGSHYGSYYYDAYAKGGYAEELPAATKVG